MFLNKVHGCLGCIIAFLCQYTKQIIKQGRVKNIIMLCESYVSKARAFSML